MTLAIPDSLLPPQERTFWKVTKALQEGRNVIVQSPTGSGKTRMSGQWLRWAVRHFDGGMFYVNRKSLIGQTSESFDQAGIPHGIRAADYPDREDPTMDVQIASADTERVRVYDKKIWPRFDCSVVIVDEAHIQKGGTMENIIIDHKRNGAKIILLSATPVSLLNFMPGAELISAGTISEFRACGLLVPAVCKSIEALDMAKIKRNKTGEFVLNDKVRKIYTQQIVGNVIDRWKRYNPNARLTMLYAPGKAESVWFTKQFNDIGVPWVHVDATEAYYDGKRYKLTRGLWADILGKLKDGTFSGVSSRFKLREGVDLPLTYQIILATPIGSIASYLQTVGRGLRSAPGKDHCLITDHGGNYLRHGSPNHDRDWGLLAKLSSAQASSFHLNQVRQGDVREPIRCPKCEGERLHGLQCPHCSHVHEKSSRMVMQADGRMITKDGNLIPRKRFRMKDDTQRKWDNMYWGYKNKGLTKSFVQLEAFFCQEHGYWPPRELYNQPKRLADWYAPVPDVPPADLRMKEK